MKPSDERDFRLFDLKLSKRMTRVAQRKVKLRCDDIALFNFFVVPVLKIKVRNVFLETWSCETWTSLKDIFVVTEGNRLFGLKLASSASKMRARLTLELKLQVLPRLKPYASLKDYDDIQSQVKSLYCAANKLRGTFSQCSPAVKSCLLNANVCLPIVKQTHPD